VKKNKPQISQITTPIRPTRNPWPDDPRPNGVLTGRASLKRRGNFVLLFYFVFQKIIVSTFFLLLVNFLPVDQEEYPGLPGGGGS